VGWQEEKIKYRIGAAEHSIEIKGSKGAMEAAMDVRLEEEIRNQARLDQLKRASAEYQVIQSSFSALDNSLISQVTRICRLNSFSQLWRAHISLSWLVFSLSWTSTFQSRMTSPTQCRHFRFIPSS